MNIGMAGVSHATAPIEVRERFSFTDRRKVEAMSELTRDFREVIILATCNRTEIYFAAERADEGVRKLRAWLKSYALHHPLEDLEGRAGSDTGKSDGESVSEPADLDRYLFSYTGRDCAEHLFLVAGGIDSQVIGEDQILSQVKDALQLGLDLKFSGKFLNRLFMNALSLGKKIRSSLQISEIPLSTSYIGILLLKKALDSFKGKTLLLVGAGQIGQLSLKYLAESGLAHLYMTNRTRCKLEPLKAEYPGMEVIDYDDRYRALEVADALISATAAPHFVIRRKDVAPRRKPLYIMDLALPKDVEPAVGDMDRVTLYNLDDLTRISEANREKRERLAGEAAAMIREDTDEYMAWLLSSRADAYIESLGKKIEEIRDDSMAFIRRKLDLTKREDAMVNQLITYALYRLTRDAIRTLKDPAHAVDDAYRQVASDLLGLSPGLADTLNDDGAADEEHADAEGAGPEKASPRMYRALVIDMADWDIRIFGGGKVALHKLNTLLRGEMKERPPAIRVIAPDFDPGFRALLSEDQAAASSVRLETGSFEKNTAAAALEGADFVVAATDSDEVNRAILRACRDRKILCETVSGAPSPVLTPSVVRDRGLGLYVTSFGRYPVLSRAVREHLQNDPYLTKFDDAFVEKLAAYRALLLKKRPDRMIELLREALDLSAEALDRRIKDIGDL